MRILNRTFAGQHYITSSIILLFLHLSTGSAIEQDNTIHGKVTSPFPTINNLAIEWLIQGDDNLNGTVVVQFREKGVREWRQAMPLRRVSAGANVKFNWENKYQGSIFDLLENTEYEIKLILNDRDRGDTEKTLIAHARPVPVAGENADIFEIKPGNYDTLFTKSGTADKPILYKCSGDTAIFTHIEVQNKKMGL